MSRSFRELLEARTVLFDGGNGTELYARGVFINRCFDELNLSQPDLVRDVHAGFLAAGADVIETNTFGANRVKLESHGFGDRVTAVNREGAALARGVANGRAFVAGAVGPLGIRIEPWGPTSVGEARELFREQIVPLVEGGVDLLSLETFSDLPELEAALAACREVCDLPVLAQMTVEEDGVSLEGVRPEWFGRKLDEWGADMIGVNCSVGPGAMLPVVESLAGSTRKRLAAMPNAGNPRNIEGRNIYLCSPEYMATYARRFLEAGVRIIGGCCGVSPAHVKAMRRVIHDAASPGSRRSVSVALPDTSEVTVVDRASKSELAAKIDRGKFVVLVEALPPRGWQVDEAIEGVRILEDAGVDAVSVPHGPRASARMSPQALAHLLRDRLGLEPVLHYTCRDKNLLGMQTDLLGAHALGLRNVLLVTGDPPKLGDYPDATGVFDVDSIGLTNMATRLNHGLDVGGGPIGAPTAFHIGVAINPGAPDLDREVSRFEWKVDAGAEFAVTQPVFDLDLLARFLARIAHVRIPVIASLWPLTSYRNAEFLNNEVPGVVVPEAVLERMRGAGNGREGAREGTEVAREILAGLPDVVEGVQVATPLGHYERTLHVVDGFLDVRARASGGPDPDADDRHAGGTPGGQD